MCGMIGANLQGHLKQPWKPERRRRWRIHQEATVTVSNQQTEFPYVGNGVTVTFAYTCQVQKAGDLQVYVNEVAVTSGITKNGIGSLSGGSVTFSAPPASGAAVRLERVVVLERTTDYQQNGDFLARVVNPDFDRLWMALQQQTAELGRAIKIPSSDLGINTTLSPAAARANNLMGFDALGNPTAIAPAAQSATALQILLATIVGAGLIGTSSGRTVQAQLDMLYQGFANITDPQYAGGAVAGTDCTAAIQAAINAKTNVFIPDGVYLAANLQYRTGSYIEGQSLAATVKLLDNALLASHNGSVADGSGFYPGNIFASTLNHNGGVWSDGGVRALDESNSTYIYQDVTITNMTLDGNKANNQIGDLGSNRSAMGAAVSIHQCKNITVRGCKIINNRLDGIHIGYTLHGGSDYCNIINNYFEGNQRINIAMITGKYNGIHNNTGKAPTGGTGVGAGSALDIEANFAGEVNYRHSITGNRLGGPLGMVAQNVAKLQGTVCSGNVWVGGLALSGSEITGGVVIDGDTFIATSNTQNWITRYGSNVSNLDDAQTSIVNCVALGFGLVMAPLAAGQHANLRVADCTVNSLSFGLLVRGYKCNFINNTFTFAGNADPATIDLSNTLGGTVTRQGKVRFSGNKFYGVSAPIFIRMTRDSTWPFAANDFVFDKRNEFSLTGHTSFLSTTGSVTLDDNLIENFTPITISTLNLFRMTMNEVRATSAQNMFSGQTGVLNDNEISDNDLFLISANVSRPRDTTICKNRIVDGNIQILYSFTSAGVGRNHVAFNSLTAKTIALTNPFSATTGGSFLASDFVANDQYKYNTFTGFSAGASIAAGLAGKYDGTFV